MLMKLLACTLTAPPAAVKLPARTTCAVSEFTVMAAPLVLITPLFTTSVVTEARPDACTVTLPALVVMALFTSTVVPAPTALNSTALAFKFVPALAIPLPLASNTRLPASVVICIEVSLALAVLVWRTLSTSRPPPKATSFTSILPSPLLLALSCANCVHGKLMPVTAVTTRLRPINDSLSTPSYSSAWPSAVEFSWLTCPLAEYSVMSLKSVDTVPRARTSLRTVMLPTASNLRPPCTYST